MSALVRVVNVMTAANLSPMTDRLRLESRFTVTLSLYLRKSRVFTLHSNVCVSVGSYGCEFVSVSPSVISWLAAHNVDIV